MTISNIIRTTILTLIATTFAITSVSAQECKNYLDWKKLNLNSTQSQQIQVLEQDWNIKYLKIQPEILENQKRLAKFLMDPKSDPLDIMATNQVIARLKEELRNEATANYLHKRAVLNIDQQHQLELMMQQMIVARQQNAMSVPVHEEQGGFMDIIQKVRWAIQQR